VSPGGPTASAPPRTCVLETPRARLTTWLPQDLSELCALHADPVAMRYMRSGVEDQARTGARLASYLEEQAGRGWTKWRVEDRTGRMIGRAGFRLSDDGRRRELGYLLEPAQWGRGLATELARALVRWHRQHPDGLEPTLAAYVCADNAASRRVLEKSGFVLAGPGEREGPGMLRYLNRPACMATGVSRRP
jgi:RimJ/RimL family protein N-acetyltransferase